MRASFASETSAADLPMPQADSGTRTSGRGLRIIEALASAWGVDSDSPDGKACGFGLASPAGR